MTSGKRGKSGWSGVRGLPPADRALWDAVKKSIQPLRRRPREARAVESEAEQPIAPKPPPKPRQPSPEPVAKPPPLAPLDRRLRQRIARGQIAIDARLDLHGLTLERARPRLAAFLAAAQARGASLVLVITGKGAAAPVDRREGERGALRRQVPLWLALPEFRPLVVGFEEAAPAHGGAGALYVRLRRPRG